MRKIVRWGLSVCLFIPSWAMAWNMTGHQVVAQIAYDQLTPTAKQQLDKPYTVLEQFYPVVDSFIVMASWPDWLKGDDVTAFNAWHYIDQPYAIDNVRHPKRTYPPNVVWAIQQSQHVLASPHANAFEKSFFLAFFMHCVGDIHQPMHTASLYSHRFPHGDKGGTLFKIHSPVATDLHHLWDNDFGFFPVTRTPSKPLVRQIADKIERTYPPSTFKTAIAVTDPTEWAHEGYDIVKTEVYTIKPNSTPSKTYIEQGTVIAEQRVALAGYRLGYLLNQLYGSGVR